MSGFLSALFILGLAKPASVVIEDVCGCVVMDDLVIMDVTIEDEEV